MSAVDRNPDISRGAGEPRQYNFAAPSGLNVNVTGTDSRTGQEFFNLSQINSILQAIVDINAATVNVKYVFEILRDGYVVYTLYDNMLKFDLQYINPLFPLNMAPGQYQIRMRQTLGTAAARTLTVVYQQRLV